MIEREISSCLLELFGKYPFVTVTGPRQSGKTTLCRETFPHLAYANLEAPDQRAFAASDPHGFLARLKDGAIIDEIQRVPDLLSYLQVLADEKGRNSLFVLTGSEHFQLSEAISQSLAGRTALLRLLPFTLAERARAGAAPGPMEQVLYSGFYPRLHDQSIEPWRGLSDYFGTYVERDVRRLGGVRDLSTFERFVRLCAGRIGRLTDLVALGADAGVSHTTARNWLGILEASYIAFRLRPLHANIRKRLVKSPKLYFYDVGLAAHLMGIEGADQITTHPLRGALFENMIVVEALKYRWNRGRSANLSFFRDSRGLECDLVLEESGKRIAIEIKAGATISSDAVATLDKVARSVPDIAVKALVYGGTDRQSRSTVEVVPFDELGDALERIEVGRELAAFTHARAAPPPSETDTDLLDAAYAKHIRPMVEGLRSALGEVAALFRKTTEISFIEFRGNETNSSGLLTPDGWERTKRDHIVGPGFEFTDNRPLRIIHRFYLSGYNLHGAGDFGLAVSCCWTFEADGMSRTLAIDEKPLESPGLDLIIYTELGSCSARIDRACANLLNHIRNEIERREAGTA